MTEDEIFGWHHQFKGYEFEPAPEDSEGQGSLFQSMGSQRDLIGPRSHSWQWWS